MRTWSGPGTAILLQRSRVRNSWHNIGGQLEIQVCISHNWHRLTEGRRPVAATGHARAHRPHGRTYLELLTLTLLNPATVIYFAALTIGLPFLGGVAERLAFAAAAFLASFSWQCLLAAFGAALGRGSGHRLRTPTMLIGNLVIVGLGVAVLAGALAGGPSTGV